MIVSNEREVRGMREVRNDEMNIISVYMDSEIREQAHAELAPCTNEEFLKRYCDLDKGFEEFIYDNFGWRIN